MEHAAETIAALSLSLFILLFCRWVWKNSDAPIVNWPVLGMLPSIIYNVSTIHNYLAEILTKSKLTLEVKMPASDLLVTCDPKNIQYILGTNSTNFNKGPAFREIFDVLGDGLLSIESDTESWKMQRKLTHAILSRTSFQRYSEKSAIKKIEDGMFRILDHFANSGVEVEMLDLCARFTFDLNCITLLGYDPCSLSLDFPEIPFNKAVSETEEAIVLRHILPIPLWKLMRWLDLGKEKKVRRAWVQVDSFIYNRIAIKRESLAAAQETEEDDLDFISSFLKEGGEQANLTGDGTGEGSLSEFPDRFLRDVALALVVAGKDTTSMGLTWFLWVVATNPLVAENIRQELSKAAHLQQALCEVLRLYSPVPFNHRSAASPDRLPSGHRVRRHTEIILPIYSIGRMEEIWGKDCLEFKPERWITDKGRIMHASTIKFNIFGSGPRSCVGKDLAMATMKIAAAAIIWNYQLEVVEGHQVVPDSSVVLRMKHGLKIKVTKKSF